MNSTVHVHLLPDLIPEDALLGGTAVVIDILRATTTMTCGLANGAERIIPCVGVEEAHATRDRLKSEKFDVLLGGERQGKPLPGFDLGNSPATYTAETVGGKTVVMTTTNGTRAMAMCRQADQIVIGSFANLSRVLEHLKDCPTVHLVCSGTHRHITSEDVLFAGAVAQKLSQLSDDHLLNDQARIAISHWNSLLNDTESRSGLPNDGKLEQAFQVSLGGMNLIKQDRGPDLAYVALIDRHQNLPILNIETWEIRNA